MPDEAQWPTELRVSPDGRTLTIAWGDGRRHSVAAELLRVESPSAEVQGHSPDQKTVVAGKRDVSIRDVREVGSYAVRLVFSDGHDTGIYTWETLRRFGENGDAMFTAYVNALAERGLTR